MNNENVWPELDDPDFPSNYAIETISPSEPVIFYTKFDFHFNDGGRQAAGFKGQARDCVARSIAIVSRLPYNVVYEALAQGTGTQRASKRTGKRAASANNGVNTDRKWFKDYMASLGYEWHSLVQVGSSQRTRLNATEMPKGDLIVKLRKHYTAIKDGKLHDTSDCSRHGQRMVYGYWKRSNDNG